MKIKDIAENIDEPMKIPDSWRFLKKGKICVRLIFEDGSYKDYYRKLKENYTFTIKGKKYLIIPYCVLLGKHATFTYYFNNPMPIYHKFERSKISADGLVKKGTTQSDNLAETVIDAQSLAVAFNSNLVNKLYSESWLTPKNLIIILIVVFILTILTLHFTGVINLFELFTGAQGVIK